MHAFDVDGGSKKMPTRAITERAQRMVHRARARDARKVTGEVEAEDGLEVDKDADGRRQPVGEERVAEPDATERRDHDVVQRLEQRAPRVPVTSGG